MQNHSHEDTALENNQKRERRACQKTKITGKIVNYNS